MGLEIPQRVRDDAHLFRRQARSELDIVREYAKSYRRRRYLRAAHAVVRYAECGPAIEARELKRQVALRAAR
jgi:hypothetical protein